MKDLTDPKWIKIKGGMFVLLGLFSAALLILEAPRWKVVGLLALCIWCFCRAYYFAFYVIEHYVDPSYKFSGLGSFCKYLIKQRRKE